MRCGCANTECRDLYIAPCDTGIDTGVSVPADGTYTVRIGFNGAFQQFDLEVKGGANIILENVLNANYVHSMMVYDADGVLLNNTCYSLRTRLVLGIGNNLNPDPPAGASKLIIVDVDGQTFTNAFFALHEIQAISTENQTYLRGPGFTQSGATITAISFGFFNGQTIFAQA